MGSIYKTTWWGYVCNSTSGWGSIYRPIANCNTPIADAYILRVETDGGIIESPQCITQ